MSLLSHNQLVDRVVEGMVLRKPASDLAGAKEVRIDYESVNSASIDITLGKFVLAEYYDGEGVKVLDYRAREKMTVNRIELDPEEGFVLLPGMFILAESEEVFHLPDDLSCEYKLKSSMARIGLEHLNAGWCDAGWNGSVLTLEIKNLCNFHAIRLRPGDKIGQMVFFSHEKVPADRSYAARGRYNNDKTVSTIKE